MNKNYLESLKKIDTSQLASRLLGLVRGSKKLYDYGLSVFATAYVLYKCDMASGTFAWSKNQLLEKDDVPNNVKDFLAKHLLEDWNLFVAYDGRFSKDELLSFLLYNNELLPTSRMDGATPQGILNLATSILDIKEGDNVLELCSGGGSFFTEAFSKAEGFNYTGIELNYVCNDIAMIRASLLEDKITLKLQDALDYVNEDKSDLIFSNYPFNLKVNDTQRGMLMRFLGIPYGTIPRMSSEWLFNAVIMHQLKEGGRAVVLMPNGRLLNSSDKNIRQYFIENGFIETVISLPENTLMCTNIQANLVVLSHGNDKVTLMDASDICMQGYGKVKLTDENVQEILVELSTKGNNVTVKTTSELAENDYVIYPSRYLETVPEIENGVELKSLSKNIFRGVQVRSAEFEEMVSNTQTDYIYLTPANIQDGMLIIEGDQYLKELPRKMQRFIVKDNFIILSRGSRGGFKSAVVSLKKGTSAIITGNLFAIDLDETKINPFYLQSFLASETGLAQINSLCVGSNVPIISLSSLENMLIPMVPLEKQKKIGLSYASAMDETILLRKKIEKSLERMKCAYDRGGRSC